MSAPNGTLGTVSWMFTQSNGSWGSVCLAYVSSDMSECSYLSCVREVRKLAFIEIKCHSIMCCSNVSGARPACGSHIAIYSSVADVRRCLRNGDVAALQPACQPFARVYHSEL
eukprot:3976145-Amphidinium_carterae.1